MGEGARLDSIRESIRQKGLTNVELKEFGNKDEARQVLLEADAAYISFKNVPVLTSGSPNKFFDALAACKLIILNFEGWLKSYVEKYECGFHYDPDRPESFYEKLAPYLTDVEKLNLAQSNARKLAEHFSLEVQLKKLDLVIG